MPDKLAQFLMEGCKQEILTEAMKLPKFFYLLDLTEPIEKILKNYYEYPDLIDYETFIDNKGIYLIAKFDFSPNNELIDTDFSEWKKENAKIEKDFKGIFSNMNYEWNMKKKTFEVEIQLVKIK